MRSNNIFEQNNLCNHHYSEQADFPKGENKEI